MSKSLSNLTVYQFTHVTESKLKNMIINLVYFTKVIIPIK